MEMQDDDTIAGIMPTQAKTPAVPKAAPVVNDLSGEIERAVEREPQDWVRCVRVFGDFYRCNWWSRKGPVGDEPNFDWAGLVTDHVRKSRFLRVTLQTGQLIIEDVPAKRP